MKKGTVVIPIVSVLIMMLSLAASARCAVFEGPLEVKNQFPLFVPALQPYLEEAATENYFTVSLSHSSTYMIKDSTEWRVHIDLELSELNLRLHRDFPGLFEIGLDVPVLRATSGFMDRPLAWYHRTFGFPDYGRSKRPNNQFLYDIERNGAPVIQGDNDQVGFGDLRFTIKKKIIENDPLVSILIEAEAPTGNARIGYGNGSFDWGTAMLFDKNLGSDARFYANLGAVFPGELKAYQTVKLKNFYYGGAGIEYFAWSDLSLLVQYLAQSSPFPGTGITLVDGTAMLLEFGARKYGKSGTYEFSLTEDPNTTGAPDFIFNLSYKKSF